QIEPTLHDPIDQALMVCKRSPNPTLARRFTAFVSSPEGREIMRRNGFLLPGEALAAPAPDKENTRPTEPPSAPPPSLEALIGGKVTVWPPDVLAAVQAISVDGDSGARNAWPLRELVQGKVG